MRVDAKAISKINGWMKKTRRCEHGASLCATDFVAARTISKYAAPGNTMRPCTRWSAMTSRSAPATGVENLENSLASAPSRC
eukprot:scaffold104841_cov29-Tisochrysis_lutea.AAC.2